MGIESGKYRIRSIEIDTPFVGIDENGGHEKVPVVTGGKDNVVRLLLPSAHAFRPPPQLHISFVVVECCADQFLALLQFTVTKLPDDTYVLYVGGSRLPRYIVDNKGPVVGDLEPTAGIWNISEDKDGTYTSAAVCLVLEYVITNLKPELPGSRSRPLVALGRP